MHSLRVLTFASAVLGLSPLLPSCTSTSERDASMPHGEMASVASLYERLGGEPAIRAVVDDFVARAASDPQVNFTRKGTAMEWDASAQNVAHLKAMLVQLIASASGGPQRYEGRGMQEAHAGMRITNAEFDALAADLKASLDHFAVPAQEQHELLTVVASTRADIVTVR